MTMRYGIKYFRILLTEMQQYYLNLMYCMVMQSKTFLGAKRKEAI